MFTKTFHRLLWLLTLLSLLGSMVCTPSAAGGTSPASSSPAVREDRTSDLRGSAPEEDWNVPTLADTTLRAGRSTIKKTADTWHTYLSLKEASHGLTFTFTKAVGTVFEGLSHKVDLNGLSLRFSGFEDLSPNSDGVFAISFGKGEYDRFAFGFLFHPKSGRVYLGRSAGSALTETGEPILEDTALTSQGLTGQIWTLSLEKDFSGAYHLQITVGDKTLEGQIPQDLIENSEYDPQSCCLSIMAVRNLPSFTLTLEGWKQNPVPLPLTEAHTLLRGTGNYSNTLSDWAKWLSVTQPESGGLRYTFTGAPHSVTEGLTLPLSLEGLRVYFSNLKIQDLGTAGRLALTFGTGALERSSFALLFDFKNGTIYAANPEVTNGTLSGGRVVPVGDALFSGDPFRYSNMAGKDWFVDFALDSKGTFTIILNIDGQQYEAAVDPAITQANAAFCPSRCYGYLMSAQGNTTLSIDLLGLTRRVVPESTDNSRLLPAYVPSTQCPTDENGTPLWLSSALIMEVNVPKATKEGALEAALPILDHAAEMGVNCLWLTAVGEPGPKNDGTAGNHYVNLGLQSIDPAITGTADYREGWQALARFVEEAHKRNIYILFNAVTWGTSPDSPIYQAHPDWYTGEELWGGKAWDWTNEALISWYTETLLEIVETTNIDGILYDCEPSYAGEAVCARFRKAIQDSGRHLVYIAESVNDRSNAYDMELYGVMDYRGYGTTSAAIGDHQKDDKEFFIEEGYNIVEAVQQGILSGSPEQQQNGTGGTYKYYTYCFSNHDSYYFSFNNNLLDVAYQGIFSPYIPVWYLGEEFHSTPSGIRLYFDQTKWANLATVANSSFLEELKELIRIRRQYDYVFDLFPEDHRQANICKVETTGDLGLQAYGRYADNTGILILGNRNPSGQSVTTTVTLPFASMELTGYDTFTLTDLLTGQVLCRGTKAQLREFTLTLDYNAIGVYALTGVGTCREGITLAQESHALFRNGTSHQVNTAVNNWGKYLSVAEAPYGEGLRFSFTEAVTTVGEGINVPLSLEDLYLHFSNLSGYLNNGTAADPSKIALSFGPGSYERNSFGLIFDFSKGAVYGARPTAGTTDRLTADSVPFIENEGLTASSLEGKDWTLQITKEDSGSYELTISVEDTVLQASIDSSFVVPTETFDPGSCHLYFTAAGAKPTLTFDLVGWGKGTEPDRYFREEQIADTRGTFTLSGALRNRGFHLDFQNAPPLTGVTLAQDLCLEGTTLYFDDLTNYRKSQGNTGYALTFSSEASEDTAFGILFDMEQGKISLCLNGCVYRELLSNPSLTYPYFRDRQWSLSFTGASPDGLELTLTLPQGSYKALISQEELSAPRSFDPERCNLHIMAWDGPLTLSLRPVGYEAPVQMEETIPFSHSLTLESSISINYMTPAESLADCTSFSLLCSLPLYQGNERIGTETRELRGELKSNGYYAFPLKGLTALQMNDSVEAQLVMEKNGITYVSSVDSYSVARYAYRQLDRAQATDKLKRLCADLLQYGSAAQQWKGYRTDSPADGAMTSAHRAWLTDPNSIVCENNSLSLGDLEDPIVVFRGKTLIMDDSVLIRLYLDPGSYADRVSELSLRVSYRDLRGQEQILCYGNLLPAPTLAGAYMVSVDCLTAAEMRTPIRAAVYLGDTRVSETIQYSIESYTAKTTGTLRDLCNAMLAYGDSAAAFFS